jgi:hypothetical protein
MLVLTDKEKAALARVKSQTAARLAELRLELAGVESRLAEIDVLGRVIGSNNLTGGELAERKSLLVEKARVESEIINCENRSHALKAALDELH